MYNKKSKLRKIKLLLNLVVVSGVFGILGVGGIFAYYAKDLPSPASIQELKIAESTKIYDRTGEKLLYDIHGEQKRTVISFQDMPAYIKHATIAAEDDEFYKHFGIDLRGIGRAMLSNIKGQAVLQGGSTITQQLIKNIYLSPERTISRKIKEMILTIEMEVKYDKDEILNFYLNVVPYGSNAYGIEAASQTFFNKHAQDLNISEAATLASLPKAPSYYSPFGNNPEKLKKRQRYILKRMLELGYITKKEHETALEEEIEYSGESRGIKAPHFVMYIKEYLENKYGKNVLKNSGLTVVTTLDFELQKEAEKIVKKWAEKNETRFNANNAALIAIDPKTGQIVSMVGSRDYYDKENDGNVNVTMRLRQPGSSFKPFAYAKAFQKGYTPNTILFDAETNFGVQGTKEYIPQNYDEKFRGPVTFKEALARSINVPAVKVLYLAGIQDTINLAKNMGITSLNEPSRYGLSLVLGGGEVTLLDETSAYGVFSQEGIFNKATGVLKITSKNGEVVEEFKPNPENVLDAETARLINSVLSDNGLRAPMFGENSYLNLKNIPSAAKTGTTQEYRDAWTVGYSKDISVGVWVGNNDNSKMYDAAGAKAAAPIWNEFMKRVYEIKNLPIKQFKKPAPSKTEKAILNGSTGGAITVEIDKISGKRATEYTPGELIVEKVFYEPHSILYFVKKDDPRGDIPEQPDKDSQFSSWEEGVQKWIKAANSKDGQKEDGRENYKKLNPTPAPREYDDIHTKETMPKILTIETNPKTQAQTGEIVRLSLKIEHTFPIKKIEIFFDKKILKTLSGVSTEEGRFQASFRVPLLKDKKQSPHSVVVRVFDEVLNKGEAETNIFIK